MMVYEMSGHENVNSGGTAEGLSFAPAVAEARAFLFAFISLAAFIPDFMQ